jgi:hypothetical protein
MAKMDKMFERLTAPRHFGGLSIQLTQDFEDDTEKV